MRRLICVLLLFASAAGAQATLNVSAGLGGTNSGLGVVSGGLWPTVSATLWLNRRMGINADFSGRGTTGPYNFGDGSHRPLLMDVNLALRPAQQFRWQPELDVGWGGVSASPNYGCLTGVVSPVAGYTVPLCTAPPNVFASGLHVGIAFTTFLSPNVFLRPVYHLYLGGNMGHPNFFGVMVGYSFGRQ